MTRPGKKQPKQSPPRNNRFSAGVLPLSIAHIVRPKQVLALLAASVPGLALAGPQGGQVVAGAASISSPNANTTNIHQASNRAAIDWQSFSLGSSDYVQFFQPNSSSVALNRVVGGNPSSILGNLTANGQVFLVNPAGVYFGQGATVDVAGLVATTMNIGNDDFMAGNYLFSRDVSSPDNATVINEGILAARDNGYVVLSGDYVNNEGIISAQLGTVALAAGAGMTLDIAGDNLINFTVDAASVSHLAGVDNAGDLYADGGRVIMTAEVADNLVNAAVNNSGRVQAQGLVEQDGAIYLVAHGGDVVNAGALDASGPDGDGGFVRVRSTDNVTLTSTSEIDATGGTGEGGVVRVIAEDNLDFQAGAAIDARGATGEQGGFVEVSGHGGLKLKGDVQVGKDGQLLVDPTDLTVSAGGSIGPTGSTANANVGEFFIETQLQSGANVALVATNSITFNGTGSFAGGDLNGVNSYGGPGGDLFIGIGSISVGSTLGFFSNSSPASFAGGIPPNYNADPTGLIALNGTNITVDGDLTLQAGTSSGNISSMASLSGNNISISAAGGSIAPSFSSLNINATGNVDITATDITFSGSTANLSVSASGSVNIDTDINLLGSGGDGNASASLTISGNGLAINGDIDVVAQDPNGPPSASIDLQGGSGALIVNGDVSALATFSGTGASSSPGSATITYAGASLLQAGNVSAIAQGTGSSGYGGTLPMNASVSMAANAGSITITGGIIQASASANGLGSSPGASSVSASAGVSLSATSGNIVLTNADVIATANALNQRDASSGSSPLSPPQATAIATVQMATSSTGSGAITISGGSINDGDILATANAQAPGSSAINSTSSVISPRSTAGANINIVGGGAITTSGSVLAVADGNSAHSFGATPSGGTNQGARVHIQSLNSSVTINNAVQAQFGLGTGDVAAQAFATINLMTGFVSGTGTTASYFGGGDITLNGGASLLASASGEDRGNAGIELWAVETDPMGAPPISGGGKIIINGSGLTAVGTEVANGGTSSQFADADISIEALGGTIALNAPVLSSAVGNDATGSNVVANVEILGGLIGAAGGPVEVAIANTVEAKTAGVGSANAQVTLEGGGDIQTSGPGLIVAPTVLLNPSYTSSGGSTFPGGNANAVFNVATKTPTVGVGNNLASATINNSAFTSNATVRFGASYDESSGALLFNGGGGAEIVNYTAGGDIGLITGGTPISVGGLSLTTPGLIGNDSPILTINTAGDLSISAAGLNLVGTISSAALTMNAGGDIVLDSPISVTDNGVTPSVIIDITAGGDLTVNQAILAEATGSSGAFVQVDLNAGSSSGNAIINADVSAIAKAQGPGGPSAFDATINIVGNAAANVFLNTGTVLAKVSDGGSATPIGGTALVHVEALGGDLTQAAAHVAKAEATGGTNATNATVELTADDQVNVAGTVIADAKGAGAATALAHIHEHTGATAGAVNVSGANITATVADFGSPSSGTRLATLEIISEQGGVSVDGATTLVNSAITATGSAFATGNIRGTGGVVNFASTLLTLASAGSFASALVDIDAGSGITGGGNFQADAVESGTGTALSKVHVDTAAGNAAVGDLAVNASGGLATGSIDVGQNIVPIPGNLTIGNISGNVTGNSNDGHLNIDLDASNGITVSGSINGVASAGANSLADAEVFIDINTGSAGANISVVGPINATATAVQSSARASVGVFGQGNVTLGNVTVTANGNNDAFSSISANAVGGNLTAGNLTVVATENSSDAEANINLDANTGNLVAGNLSATGSGQGSGSADIDVDAQTVTVGNVTALATGATDEAFATIDVHATSGNATLATVLASATASSFGEASIDIDANNGAVVTGAVTATGIAASDASGSIDIFATGNIITGPLTITVDGGSDSADADLDVQSQGGSVTINGGLTVDVRADDYIGTISASVRTGGAGFTGGDITVNGNAQVMTLGSYASAELNITAFSNAGAGGDIIVNGAAIAKASWQAGTSNSDNTALVDLDAQAGSLTVTGQTLAQASHQNSESANAFIVLQADTGVNVQNVSALATAPSSDASASVSISANSGAVNAGAITVTALADTASGDAFAGFDATTLAGAITVNGAINLLASGGTGAFDDVNAIASLLTPTNLQLNGPVSINTVGGTGPSDGAIFFGFANNVTANGLISVISQTPNTEALIAFDGDGGGGPGNGTLIASTSAPNLEVADFANATVDNTSSTAPLSLDLNGSLGNLSVTTSGDMNFNGQSAFASGNVLLGANGDLDASLSTLSASVVDLVAGSGDLLLNGASIIGTDGVFLSAGGSVLNGPALIDGGMVGVFAGQDIDLSLSDIFVGTASDASRLPGDPVVTDILLANGISVPSNNPNALFLAGNSVQIGNLDMSGHYLWVESNQISFTGTVSTPQNVLAQLLPSDPLASIGVTQSESFNQLVNFNNEDHFEPFSGTTIAIGASFINSNITIDAIDVGSKNMLFVTNGTVAGDELVTTTGLVALLSLTPVTDETIDIVNTIDSVDDLVASGKTGTSPDELDEEEDDENEDDDGETVTDGGGEGGDALIEQDDNPDESLECA